MHHFSFGCKISSFSIAGVKSLSCLSVALDLFQWMPFQGDQPICGFTTPEMNSGCFKDKCFLRKSGTSLCFCSTNMLLGWGVTQQTPGDTLDVLGCVTCSLVFVPKAYGSPMGLMSYVSTLPRKLKYTRQLKWHQLFMFRKIEWGI